MSKTIKIKLPITKDIHLAGFERVPYELFMELLHKKLIQKEFEWGEPEDPIWVIDVKEALKEGYEIISATGNKFKNISELEKFVADGGLLENIEGP